MTPELYASLFPFALWAGICLPLSAVLALLLNARTRAAGGASGGPAPGRPYRWWYFVSILAITGGMAAVPLFAESAPLAFVGPLYIVLGMGAITRSRRSMALLTLAVWPPAALLALWFCAGLGRMDVGIFIDLLLAGALFLHCAYLRRRRGTYAPERGGRSAAGTPAPDLRDDRR